METKYYKIGFFLALFFVFLLGNMQVDTAGAKSKYIAPKIIAICQDNYLGRDYNKNLYGRCKDVWLSMKRSHIEELINIENRFGSNIIGYEIYEDLSHKILYK